MSEVDDLIRRYSQSALALQLAIDNADGCCSDEIYVEVKKRYLQPQLEMQDRFLSMFPAISELIAQVESKLRDIPQ